MSSWLVRRFSSLRLWWALGALAIVIGRLSSTISPFAALLAPVVCSICHGCPAKEHDHVCDCESCEIAAASAHDGVPLLQDAPHGHADDHTANADGPAVLPPLPRVVLALVLLDELAAEARVLAPRPLPEPDVPPPRRTQA